MLPLSDGVPARRFPIVNASLIVANFAVFIFCELPNLNFAVYHTSFSRAPPTTPAGGIPVGPAWIFLGRWFLYQLIEADFGLFNAKANGGAVAFFAHVGGFIFGLLVARLFAARAGQAAPEERWPWTT